MSGSSGGYCPICGKSYGPEADRCPIHGFLFQSRDALRPGVVIDGAYEILDRLGAGGMGETYLVRHAYLGENLVLKRIRPELAEDPLYQQSFLREAHSLAALRKLPAVVEIRNAWQTREGYLALLLEYVEGGNLLRWLETERGGGPLEVLEAVAVAADLAKALASAHAIGVLHRDVKPQNILMRQLESGGFQLKLCDFGLAVQRVEEMSQQGTTTTRLGTPGYAAPEQYTLSSREQDARVDVFGLGMTLYRLAAGRLPWEASSASWPLVCKEQPRKSLKELRPSLGREYWLESLLLRLTAVERNDRIATAAEALELMQEALAETRPAPRVPPPIAAPPPPPRAFVVTAIEQEVPVAPMAVAGGTGEEWQVEPTAGAQAPALSPEPPLPPPAELQQPHEDTADESCEEIGWQAEAPAPPVRISSAGDVVGQALPSSLQLPEQEVSTETAPLTGATGQPPLLPPAAELQQPREDTADESCEEIGWQAEAPAPPASEPLDGKVGQALSPALPAALPVSLQLPEQEVATETVALTAATGHEPRAEPVASLEIPADVATPADDKSASPPTLSPEAEIVAAAESRQPLPPPAQMSEDTATEQDVPAETAPSIGATGYDRHVEPIASTEMPAEAAAPVDHQSALAPEPQQPRVQAPENTAAGHEVPGVLAAAPGATGEEPHSVPAGGAEMPAGAEARADAASAQARADLPEPGEGAVERPATEVPLLRSQLGPNSLSKRRIALGAFGFAVIVLMLVWWSARQTPSDVPGNPPVQAEQGQQPPATHPRAPATGPPGGELSSLRTSAAGAIRVRDWSKAGPLIDSILARLPADAEALGWRKLVLQGRQSDLDVAKAEQLFEQGDYPAAIAMFQRALASDPGNVRARSGLIRASDAKADEDIVFGRGR